MTARATEGHRGPGSSLLLVMVTLIAAATGCDNPAAPPTAPDPTFEQVSIAHTWSCALTTEGMLWCWGNRSYFALSSRDRGGAGSPGRWNDIAVGEGHVCMVDESAEVFCSGLNYWGELGVGDFTIRNVPVRTGLTGATDVDVGLSNTCALTGDGLYCWGSNFVGAAGLGDLPGSTTPVPIHLATPVYLGLGPGQSCAVLPAGELYCWGANAVGELSDPPGTLTLPTRLLPHLSFAAADPGSMHVCGLTSDGTAYCWGDDRYGQRGTSDPYASPPRSVPLTSSATAIVSGSSHSCALKTDGSVSCWGWNGRGQLGRGDTIRSAMPVEPAGLPPMASIAAAGYRTCGVSRSGDIYCWGDALVGQFGEPAENLYDNVLTPQLMDIPAIGVHVP